jgi:hypothetical protein
VANRILKEGKSAVEVLESMGILDRERFEVILDPWKMTEPGISGKNSKGKK